MFARKPRPPRCGTRPRRSSIEHVPIYIIIHEQNGCRRAWTVHSVLVTSRSIAVLVTHVYMFVRFLALEIVGTEAINSKAEPSDLCKCVQYTQAATCDCQ